LVILINSTYSLETKQLLLDHTDIPVFNRVLYYVALWFLRNVLTLLAIVLATGLEVDDGIVVTENIFKKEEGMTPIEAADMDRMRYSLP
jgi:hypothetical protein